VTIRRLSRHAALWLPPLVYMALIFMFSSESNPIPDVTEHVWDKLLHTVEYGTLAILLARAFAGEGLAWLSASVIAIMLTIGYGATDEYHQWFVPGRSSDVRDWVADSLGAVVGAAAYTIATTRRSSGS
jgi:VanZ family protein